MSVQSAHRPTAASPGLSTRAPVAAITAELTFISPSDTKPSFQSPAFTGGAPRVFFETERHAVPIHDMRSLAGKLSLDREGFDLLHRPTSVDDLYDDEAVETRYYAEIEALVTQAVGASRVVIFDATRRSDAGPGAPNRDGARAPASRVHVDYTVKSGPQRVKDLLGAEEAARLQAAGARIVQVNVWRPIRGPVERSPLALADATSVAPEDLIATDQVFPNRVGEIYHLAHGAGQRWYYAPWMTADEVLLIKGWDSLDDGRARFTPHGAFEQPDTPAGAAPRESIEVRTLAIIEA